MKTIEQVLAEYQTLSANGFDYCRGYVFEGTADARLAQFKSLSDEVAKCVDWLSDVRMIKTIYPHRGSYGLKHDVEESSGTYIPNGCLIMAALMLGYPMRRHDGPNAWFGISARDVKRKRR